jgi:short-subunit dehydrogenase
MKIALITGASQGIGLATAKILAQNEYRIYGTARSLKACSELMRDLGDRYNDRIKFIEMDVTRTETIKKGVEYIMEKEAGIDAVICNAGFGLFGSIEEMPDELVQKQFDVNVFGVLRTVQAVLPYMRARNAGRIILISSVSSSMIIPYQTHYSASKSAVDALAEGLRQELYGTDIKVSAIRSGHARTGFLHHQTKHIPDGSPYKKWMNRALDKTYKNLAFAPYPAITAAAVHRVLQKANPRAFYTAGVVFERAAPFMAGIMPSGLKEMIIRKFYKIDFK